MSAGQLAAIFAREQQAFASARPQSRALAQRSSAHFPHGVPMHWMRDWGTAFPLFVHEAQGDRVTLAWVLLGGVNTDPAEVERIRAAFGHLPLRINLIDVNANPVSPGGETSGETFRRATDEERNTFMDALQVLKSPVVRRYSVGRDQNAACGMLAARTAVEPDTASCP